MSGKPKIPVLDECTIKFIYDATIKLYEAEGHLNRPSLADVRMVLKAVTIVNVALRELRKHGAK